jgi:transposase
MTNKIKKMFLSSTSPNQRRYEILRAVFVEDLPREEIAVKFKTTANTVNSYVYDFKQDPDIESLFTKPEYGRKAKIEITKIKDSILILRKQNLSVPEIKAVLDSQQKSVSEKQIYNILQKDGFLRLPRRTKEEKKLSQSSVREVAEKSEKTTLPIGYLHTSQAAGIFCFLPYLEKSGILQAIESSNYPETNSLSKTNSILSFVALKLSNFGRYTKDDQWCMDAGLGLFAGLNVLPKAAWFSSYSHKVTREMNLDFLKVLNNIWRQAGYFSDTANLDFSTIPYWGNDTEHLSNHWSGTRNKALLSILAALAQDPETGLIRYGDTTVGEDEKDTILEFLDFSSKEDPNLKWVVFDSKFTTYENLSKINERGINFITIRRRGSRVVAEIEKLPKESLQKIRIPTSKGTREILINESFIELNGYKGKVRQIAIVGSKRLKPALIISNNMKVSVVEIVRKYAQRWLVEKEISEQIHFFHLNQPSSSIVIKVDFDLIMTILSHNLCRILANDFEGYENVNCGTLFDKFLMNSGRINITKEKVVVELKKKRELPLILTAMKQHNGMKMPLFNNKIFEIQGWTTT